MNLQFRTQLYTTFGFTMYNIRTYISHSLVLVLLKLHMMFNKFTNYLDVILPTLIKKKNFDSYLPRYLPTYLVNTENIFPFVL